MNYPKKLILKKSSKNILKTMQAEVIYNKKKISKKINLNKFIEENSIFLKKEFLKKVENLGQKKILRKKLKDFFNVNEHVNLWELSHLNEKNIFKGDYINICLQYLAILKIIKDYN